MDHNQADWNQEGEDFFNLSILDKLPYSKDLSKTDYTEGSNKLSLLWQGKLIQEAK